MLDSTTDKPGAEIERKAQTAAADGEPGRYAVGYGKPPKTTQFKKGQSGNSRGRQKCKPEEIADLRLVIENVLAEPMTVRERGKVRTVTALEAIWNAQMANALKKPKAFRDLFKKAQKMGLFSEAKPTSSIVITPAGTDEQQRLLRAFHGSAQ